jgi:predicted ArsR family transcriptional regulator
MTGMANNIENISDVQQQILTFIKRQGETTNADIAGHLNVSYEAVRQQLRQLEAAQLVVSRKQRDETQRAGRPTQVYALSAAGDHLFPKAYDELAVELIDTLAAVLGPEALRHVLASLTDDSVRRWAPQLYDKTLLERLETLKGFYLENDPYMEYEYNDQTRTSNLCQRQW